MQRVVIDIPDHKFHFFMELVQQLGFEKVKPLSAEKQEFVADLEQSLEQVKLHQEGKIELQTAEEFLDEL